MTTSRRRRLAAGIVPAALVALWWALPSLVPLDQGAAITFDEEAIAAEVTSLGERGAYALRYVDGGYTTLTVPVTNDGPLPIRVVGARLSDDVRPLLATVSVVAGDPAAGDSGSAATLAPGGSTQMTVTVRHDHCEYYTERALGVFRGLDVEIEVLGRRATRHVSFDHDLVVRSPMMVTCPDRVRDRDGNQRRATG